ncbi:MAG: GAF domain-containing protein [Myxococcota bacterium]|nr:GAF domain-containing protein [Myxococcota bacterium]
MTEKRLKIITLFINLISGISFGILINGKSWMLLAVVGLIFCLWNLYAIVRLPRSRIELLLRLVHDQLSPGVGDNVRCGFLVPTRKGNIVKISSYENRKFNHKRRIVRAGIGTAGRAFSSRREVILPELRGDFREVMLRDWGFTSSEVDKLQQDRKSYASMPFLNDRGDEVLGVICVDAATPRFPTADRLDILRWFIPYFSAILENER